MPMCTAYASNTYHSLKIEAKKSLSRLTRKRARSCQILVCPSCFKVTAWIEN